MAQPVEYAVGYSPLSHNIYAGRISATRDVFTSKTTVTNMALGAAAEWIIDNGSYDLTNKRTGVTYRLTCEVVETEGDDDGV